MTLSETEKTDLLAIITMEMERMFGVLANSCKSPTDERAKYFADVEGKIKTLLAEHNLIIEIA